MENLRALRKFGKITEQKLEHWYGKDVYESFETAAAGLTVPVPIMGIPASLSRRGVMPRAAGGMGFASLSDLITEATANAKLQQLTYTKTGVAAAAAANSQSLWGVGALPSAGAAAGNAPSGSTADHTTTGGLRQSNPAGSDTLHLTTWSGLSTVVGSLMLYDYLWGVQINHATQANGITGVPTRYQSTNAAGTFISGRVTSALGATAHNITVTYTDQDGNTAQTTTALAVRVSSALNTMPITQPAWFLSLAAGDVGVRSMGSIALSAASSGSADWFMGHPLAILPQPVANVSYVLDGINSAFNLVQVQGSACLALMEFFKSATTATTYSGMVQLVSG